MTVTFTMLARLNLLPILREVRGGLDDDARKIARRILKKIKVPTPELNKIQQKMPDGRIMVDMEKLEECDDLVVNDLTEDQADKIVTLIRAGKSWGPDDDDWIDPLLEQLEADKNRPVAVA